MQLKIKIAKYQPYSIALLVMSMPLVCAGEKLNDIASQIPKAVNGWVATEADRTYNRKTLFQYINGGAELYLAYQFRKVWVRRYTKPNEWEIVLDIYDMTTSEDAYGVFTIEREGDEIGIGQGSEYAEGLLRFWKGRFFIAILAREETRESKRAVLTLARAVDNAIQSTGSKPKLLSLLPTDGLVEKSICFFRKHTILNHRYYIANKNILQLSMRTEALLARYALQEGKPYLLLVQYPSGRRAKSAYKTFTKAYIPEAIHNHIAQLEDGKWVAVALHKKLLIAVLDAPTHQCAQTLLSAVCAKLGVKRK
ncbi:MAG TPA: hypothetical protein EYP10_14520 [Armatimonadetes bacterium]|nr:hypothetical protein [Armatimonadota bacterium]